MRRSAWNVALLIPLWSSLAAQDPEIITLRVGSGRIVGEAVSAATGDPLPFVLVSLDRPRVDFFASERGRFSLPPLDPGQHRLRLRQLGYLPVDLVLVVGEGPGEPLRVALVPQAFRLPTLVASACLPASDLAPEVLAVLDAAAENGRRLSVLAREYRFIARFLSIRETSDRAGKVLSRIPMRFDLKSWDAVAYRPGKAIVEGRGGPDVAYFAATAVLSDDFRNTHCFRIAESDTTPEGEALFRLEFEPLESLQGPDWAGTLEIDQRGVLRRSSAELVARKPKKSWPERVQCVVWYEAVGGALPIESRLVCQLTVGPPKAADVLEEWRLECQSFVRQVPGVQTGFPPDSTGVWARRMCPQ